MNRVAKAVLVLGISSRTAILSSNEENEEQFLNDYQEDLTDYHEDLTDEMPRKVGHLEPEFETTEKEEEQLQEAVIEQR